MCSTGLESSLTVVKVYTFFNLIILIFSIVHYVVAFNPATYISDKQEYTMNFEGDVAITFIMAATRYLVVFLFNLVNSIVLWRQHYNGGIKERVVMEAACISISYFELIIESIILLVTPGNFVSSVVPLFVLSILMFLVGVYFTVIIVYSSDEIEKKFIRNLEEEGKKMNAQRGETKQGQNLEINFGVPQNEEENKNNGEIELNAVKHKGEYGMVVENSKFHMNDKNL